MHQPAASPADLNSATSPASANPQPVVREVSPTPRPSLLASELIRDFYDWNIVIVVPAYNEQEHIESTIRSIPDFVSTVVVVDDASQDSTPEIVNRVAQDDQRVILLRHQQNEGIGSGMISGYERALELDADIVVKMDADGQMSAADLPALLRPLVRGAADYAKGNRFHDFRALRQMPVVRRVGNMVLGFLTKAAVGYWDCFDPCNGYVAIRADVLHDIPPSALGKSFFFETSMLAQLYLMGAVVKDVPMPARYAMETSHLSIGRTLVEFPIRLLTCFARRMVLKNFVYDFSVQTVYLMVGIPMLLAGAIYGGTQWLAHFLEGTAAPTGTVVIPAMLIILGFQLLLAAIGEDLRSTPQEPLWQQLVWTGNDKSPGVFSNGYRSPGKQTSHGEPDD